VNGVTAIFLFLVFWRITSIFVKWRNSFS
jgi:hypothetical protein